MATKAGPINFQEKMTEASLTGNLYYSKSQWKYLREQGRDRTFAKLIDGSFVEYTEMITLEMLAENPGDVCPVPDAELIGRGTFAYFADEKGREYR